jgi:hypothetical protein
MNTTSEQASISDKKLAADSRDRDLFFLNLLRGQIPFLLKHEDRPLLSPATWDGEPAFICLNHEEFFGAVFSKSGKFLGMAYE